MAARDHKTVRVLVVDDSEVFRQTMCAVVAATPGFEIAGDATSGREALALISSLGVELVLLDVEMPEMDGIETAIRIRREYPDVVVLLLSAAWRQQLGDGSLSIQDKQDLSSRWLADFWRRHGHTRTPDDGPQLDNV